MTKNEKLIPEIVDLIVDSLNLHFVNKQDLNASTQLIGEGLGLDSVDLLEVVVALEQRYNVKIKTAEQGHSVFRNIGSIADFVLQSQSIPVADAVQ
jgi:acyl carrier protein